MRNTRDSAIKFLQNRRKEEEKKEHNFVFEIDNCLFHLRKNKCKSCVFGRMKENASFGTAGPLQCQRCSENYSLLYIKLRDQEN